MAKTIIKGGKNEFTGHCRWCGCDFRYTSDDVLAADDSVSCPHCGRMLKHHGEHGTGEQPRHDHGYWLQAQQQNVAEAFWGRKGRQ